MSKNRPPRLKCKFGPEHFRALRYIAEEFDSGIPDLVVHDSDGCEYTVKLEINVTDGSERDPEDE